MAAHDSDRLKVQLFMSLESQARTCVVQLSAETLMRRQITASHCSWCDF